MLRLIKQISRNRNILLFFFLAASAVFAVSSVISASFTDGTQNHYGKTDRRSIHSQDLWRTYWLYTPTSYNDEQPRPLVIVFHGGHGRGNRLENRIGMDAVADRENFIVAYPDAAGDRHWNDGRPTTENGIDDILFVNTMIDDIEKLRKIDPDRIYVTGMSNGGSFVARLACEKPDRFAAFAQVASTMSVELAETCNPVKPLPVMMINGTADNLVRWNGGELRKSGKLGNGGKVIGVMEAIDKWAKLDKCSGKPVISMLADRDPDDMTHIKMIRYNDCSAQSEVVLLEVQGGGHAWPGATENARIKRIVGITSKDINASEEIWQFFSGHTLSER
jgi:polyhydroxybutyrate depolymerase